MISDTGTTTKERVKSNEQCDEFKRVEDSALAISMPMADLQHLETSQMGNGEQGKRCKRI